jgi:DNA topoisomerase I
MEETPPEPSDEVCENCGKPMQIRTGRYGKFLACTDYPECKTSRPILVKLGKPCPKCGEGELVEKKGRTGRPFYGCARYPACDWVTWARPLPEPCEVCGGLRIPLAQDKIHCMGCDGELPVRPRKTDAAGGTTGRGRAPAGRRTAAASRTGSASKTTSRSRATAAAKATDDEAAPTTRRTAAAKSSTTKKATGTASKNGTAKTGTAAKSGTAKGATAKGTAASKGRTAKTGTTATGAKSGAARKAPARTRASTTAVRAPRAS